MCALWEPSHLQARAREARKLLNQPPRKLKRSATNYIIMSIHCLLTEGVHHSHYLKGILTALKYNHPVQSKHELHLYTVTKSTMSAPSGIFIHIFCSKENNLSFGRLLKSLYLWGNFHLVSSPMA